MNNNNTFSIGTVIMNGVKKEFSRRALVRINGASDDGIRKIAEYLFAVFNSFANNKPYLYSYSELDQDCCWVEINGNTTGLIFIISKKKETKPDDNNTVDFTDMLFGDVSQIVFNWITDNATKIILKTPTAREILAEYMRSKYSAIVQKKVMALLKIADCDVFQAIRVTKGDPNSEEIIELLNYYEKLKQNEKQD